jgi:hypothetical protein
MARLALPGDRRLSEDEMTAVLAEQDDDGNVQLSAGRYDIGGVTLNGESRGMLQWPQPHCEPFREALYHPRLGPVLDTILGRGYRLDHGPSSPGR